MITAASSFDFQVALDSIAYGSLFALLALGLALLFGVMGLMNFAYGELIMAGGFTMFYTRSWGWVGMMLMVVAVVTVLSLLMELIAFRPVRRAAPVVLLITSFAVSYFLEALGWMTVGTGPQKGVEPYPWLNYQYSISGVRIARLTIVIWVVTIVLLVAMTLLLKKTTLGIQLRASTEDFRMAQLVGVRANWVISAAFGITGLLASAVAILYVLRAELPATGGNPPNNHTLVFAFFAVIAILVFKPEGLITLRAAPLRRLWTRLRSKPALEGTGA